jgi:hypothetical protein
MNRINWTAVTFVLALITWLLVLGLFLASPVSASSGWYPCPTLRCEQERDLRLGILDRGGIDDGRDRWQPIRLEDLNVPRTPLFGVDPIFVLE